MSSRRRSYTRRWRAARRIALALLAVVAMPLLPLALRRNPLRLFLLLPLFEALFCVWLRCERGPDTANEGW